MPWCRTSLVLPSARAFYWPSTLASFRALVSGRKPLLPHQPRPPHFQPGINSGPCSLTLHSCSRTRRAMSSPRSCYFTGLATSVPPVLGELAAHVLSTFTLGPRWVGAWVHIEADAQKGGRPKGSCPCTLQAAGLPDAAPA